MLNSCLEIVSIPHRGKSEMKLEVGARRERKVVFTNVKIVKVRRKRLNFSSSFAPKIRESKSFYGVKMICVRRRDLRVSTFFPLSIAQFPRMAVIAEMECFESETPLFFNPKSRVSAFSRFVNFANFHTGPAAVFQKGQIHFFTAIIPLFHFHVGIK